MDLKSFGKAAQSDGILPGQSIIIVGDRRDIQLRSIEMSVRLLVITGNLPVEDDVVERAKAAGVALVFSVSSKPRTHVATHWAPPPRRCSADEA
jgi:manganese-dependent inorganic pyrophosphatase